MTMKTKSFPELCDEMAQKKGYKAKQFIFPLSNKSDSIVCEAAEIYAKEVAKEAIRVARENMRVKKGISRPFTEEEILKIVGL